jgi:hypothetical protein
MEQNKIIAAILAAQAIMVTVPTAGDPTVQVVDLYERILAELRRRDHEEHGSAGPAATGVRTTTRS